MDVRGLRGASARAVALAAIAVGVVVAGWLYVEDQVVLPIPHRTPSADVSYLTATECVAEGGTSHPGLAGIQYSRPVCSFPNGRIYRPDLSIRLPRLEDLVRFVLFAVAAYLVIGALVLVARRLDEGPPRV